MSDSSIRRVVGGVGAFAVAAGFAVAGAGVAGAAPGSVTWNDGNEKLTRTISDTTPAEGDIVTSSTKLERTGGVVEYIYALKDIHPTCLTYVPGSAKVNGQARNLHSQGADFAKVEGSAVEWPLRALVNPNSYTFEFQYKVGADCARNVPLMTTVHYNGSLGSGTYHDKGPTVAVRKNATTTTLAAVTGAQVGQAVTLSASVVGGADGDTVEFYDGAALLGAGTLTAGVATHSWTPGTRGAHALTAKYLGTAKADGSTSAARAVDVEQADATSTLAIDAVSGAQVGRSSVLTATVSPAAAGGTVTFKDGAATLAEVSVDAAGKATYTWVPSTAGSHQITATFSGRSGITGSSAQATVAVAEAPAGNTASTTTVTVGANATVGVAGTVSATVNPGNAGGTVTFKDGDTVIGVAAVDANGAASVAWTPATAGQRVIRAEYSGAGTVNSSSDDVSVQVAAAAGGGSLESIFGS